MEIDEAKEEEQNEEEVPSPTTPDRSDDETDAEDDVSAPQIREVLSETVDSAAAATAKSDNGEVGGVPPPRSLPFGRPSTRSKDVKKKTPPPQDDGDDDETDDEEL